MAGRVLCRPAQRTAWTGRRPRSPRARGRGAALRKPSAAWQVREPRPGLRAVMHARPATLRGRPCGMRWSQLPRRVLLCRLTHNPPLVCHQSALTHESMRAGMHSLRSGTASPHPDLRQWHAPRYFGATVSERTARAAAVGPRGAPARSCRRPRRQTASSSSSPCVPRS